MKIGKNRIAVLIGKDGETKRNIEHILGVLINLDSKTGDCEIMPEPNNPNYMPLNVFTAQKVVKAINRGFKSYENCTYTIKSFEIYLKDYEKEEFRELYSVEDIKNKNNLLNELKEIIYGKDLMNNASNLYRDNF